MRISSRQSNSPLPKYVIVIDSKPFAKFFNSCDFSLDSMCVSSLGNLYSNIF